MANETQAHTLEVIPVQPSSSGRAVAAAFSPFAINLFFIFVLTSFHSCREAQQFVDTFEGALGKGKGRKLYAYKVMMTKVIQNISSFSLIY